MSIIKAVFTNKMSARGEMELPIIFFMTPEFQRKLLIHSAIFDDMDKNWFMVGDDIDLEITKNEAIEMIKNAKDMAPEEYQCYRKFATPIKWGIFNFLERFFYQNIDIIEEAYGKKPDPLVLELYEYYLESQTILDSYLD